MRVFSWLLIISRYIKHLRYFFYAASCPLAEFRGKADGRQALDITSFF